MGCDGGTIPKRHELVRTKQRPEQKDKDMDRNAKWTCCTITQQTLTPPIVSCELGKLYRLSFLGNSPSPDVFYTVDRLHRSHSQLVQGITIPQHMSADLRAPSPPAQVAEESASHIRNLKDVKELKLTPNSGFDQRGKNIAGEYDDTQSAAYVCPVAGLEMNGRYKFCFFWSCGCVLSERAIKEVPSEVCHKCGKPYQNSDVVVLNPDLEVDLPAMQVNMVARREQAKKDRKQKKLKRKSEEPPVCAGPSSASEVNGFKIPQSVGAISSNGLKKAKLSDSDSKASETVAKSAHDGSNGKSKAKKKISSDAASKKLSENPKESKVYKSLFTSSEGFKGRPKDNTAHWITYNPYHL